MKTRIAGTPLAPSDADEASVEPRVHLQGDPLPASARTADVILRFGLNPEPEPFVLGGDLAIALKAGTITLIAGPSGSGKSALLDVMGSLVPTARRVDRLAFPRDRAIVDAVAPSRPLKNALMVLTACGLSEPRLWLRRFAELSAGERFRATLARAIGLDLHDGNSPPLFCDEFGSLLHRRAARAIAFNLRKLVSRCGLCFVAAVSHDDLVADLQPDAVVRLAGRGEHETTRRAVRPDKPFSLARRLCIEPGRKRDYDCFATMHYRKRDELGFVDRVFLLREGIGGEPLGIVVYAHGAIELALRNIATEKRFVRDPARLNRELRVIRRVVVHPDVRGCGLAQYLIRETMPRVGVPYVECLAAMGELNPVFERAGMQRIGRCARPAGQVRVLEQLRRMRVDPFRPDFVTKVSRRPKLRQLIAQAVGDWYRASTGGGQDRVAGQSPRFLAETFRQVLGSRPVYYLWCNDEKRHRQLRTVASDEPGVPDENTTRPAAIIDTSSSEAA